MIGPEFWAGLWAHEATMLLEGGQRVVVDDMRFPNEVRAVRQLGGLSVYIIGVRNAHLQTDNHPSEDGTIRERCDLVLHNDGDFNLLRHRLEAILAHDFDREGLEQINPVLSFLVEGYP
jgi:hypothetical protein